MTELLPCPFCGGSVHIVKAHCADMTDWIKHDTMPVPCGIEGFGDFGENLDVASLWNTRAPIQPIDIEKLKREATIWYDENFGKGVTMPTDRQVMWGYIDHLAAHYNITKKEK